MGVPGMKHWGRRFVIGSVGTLLTLSTISPVMASGRPVAAKRTAAPVHLTVWVPTAGNQNQPWINIVNIFNRKYKSQNISASIQFFSWSDYATKLQVAMTAGVGPDVLFNGAAATAGLVTSKTVLPLNRFLTKDSPVKNVLPAYEKQTVFKGHSWFVPVEASVLLLEYRKDLFKAAHLSPPATWPELLHDAVRLTVPGKRLGLDLPSSGIPLEQAFSEFLYSNGGNFVDPTGRHAIVDSAQAVQSMHWYKLFFSRGAANIKFVAPSGADPIGTGQAAMELAQGNMANIKSLYPAIYNEIGFDPFPRAPRGKENVSFAAANGFYISAQTKYPRDAWLFLETALKDSGSLAESQGFSPVLKQDQHAAWIERDPELKAMYQDIAKSHLQGNPNIPQWINIRNTFATDAQAALYGQSSSSVMAKTNADLQQILNQQ